MILESALLIQAAAIVGLILSRHHLRARHRAAKAALTRVAGERDFYRWHGKRLADDHPDHPDAIAIKEGTEQANGKH